MTRVIHRVTWVWALFALVVFSVAGRQRWLDHQPGRHAFEIEVRTVFVVLLAIGIAAAWRWWLAGGVVVGCAAAALAVFGAGQLEPDHASLVVVAFLLPATVWVLLGLDSRRPGMALVTLAGVTAVWAAAGGVAAATHHEYYGPTHPDSSEVALPDSTVEWVWVGAVTGSTATVVARVDPGAESVRLAYGLDAELERPHLTVPVSPDEHGVARFELNGLEPDHRYRYAVETDGVLDLVRTGRVRTFPVGPASFTVVAGGCARVGSNAAVFDTIAAQDPLLFLSMGDLHYANIDRNDPGAFREVLDHTLTRPAQAALYRRTAIAYVWDDHDFGANNADGTSPSRPAAMQVYREYVPHYPLADADAPIHQAFTVGRVRFILTDSRSERSPSSLTDDDGKTMLGADQLAWLKQELADANDVYRAIVWVNPDPWIGEAEPGADSWAGYTTERAEIADFIAAEKVRGLVMISGDAHMVAIDDGTNTDYSSTGGAAFPLLHAAALDKRASIKGGPYSHGAIAGGGQFGVIDVIDDGGDTIVVTLSANDWRGTTLMSHGVELPA